MKDGKFTAGDIYSLLYDRYKDHREYFCAREVSDQTGWSNRRLDFVACDCYASKGFAIYAFEVKISKSDLRNELFDPTKHNVFFENIDFFSIVAPDYVLDAEYIALIPKQWGIIKAIAGNDKLPNRLVTYRKPLALHDEHDYKMSRDFVFSLMRRLRDDPSNKSTEAEMRLAEYKKGYEEGKRWCAKTDYEKLYHQCEQEKTKFSEALSTLGVHAWWRGEINELVEKATERKAEIEKFEKAYNALQRIDWSVEELERMVSAFKSAVSPMLEAKKEADKTEQNLKERKF